MAFIYCIQFWPTMKIDRSETGLHIFTKYFNKIDQDKVKQFIEQQTEIGKNKSFSSQFTTLGIVLYNEKKYVEAMNCYTKSIAYAPHDSAEFGLAIVSRLTVLFDLQRYKDCLVDIRRILKIPYFKDTFYKIFTRQAQCYVALKCYQEAYEAIENAKSHFKVAKETSKKVDIDETYKSIMEMSETLENNLKVSMAVDHKEQPGVPDLTSGENPHFVYASKAVAMKKNKRCGRHIVATVDIKKGDVLFVEEPFSTGLFVVNNNCFLYCSHCFTSSLTCISCKSCTFVFYCTDECRQQNWDAKHRWECASIRRKLVAPDQYLVLGILFRASRTGFRTAVPNTRIFGNKQDNYPYMNLLMTHKNDIAEYLYITYVKVATFLVIYLIHFTDYFDWLHVQENVSQRSRDQLYRMVGGLLLKYLSQVNSNGEIITDTWVVVTNKNSVSLTGDEIAYALYVSSSLLSHSCMPNAVKSFHGKTKIVRALSDIKKGSEVTINYLAYENLAMLNPERAKELKDKFYFSCSCRICVAEDSFFPWLCPECQGPALATTDKRTAKCRSCQHVFSLSAYKITATRCLNRAEMYLTANLHKSMQILKRIFHPSCPYFWPGHYNLTIECRTRGEFKSSLEHIDLAIDLYKGIYGDTVSQCMLFMMLERSLTLVNYCLAVKQEIPTLHKEVLRDATETIANAVSILKHHMLPQHVDSYQRGLMDILNTEDPCLDDKMIVFHNNKLNTPAI